MGDLEARIEALEEEKRKLLSSWQHERQENVLKNERNQSMRTELMQTTLALELAQGAEKSGQYKARSLEQQLSLARQDADWVRQELAKEHQARASSCAELTSRLSQSETALELAKQERNSIGMQLAQTERALKDLQLKHTDTSNRVVQLQSTLAFQEQDARLEIEGLKSSVKLSEARVQHAEQRAAQLEATCDEFVAKAGERQDNAEQAIQEQQQYNQTLQEENHTLQAALDRLAGALGIDIKDGNMQSAPQPSTTASIASRIQHEGKSFSDVYVDLVRTQEELRRERIETGRLEGVLAEVMADLDAHAPQLKAQRDENVQLREALDEAYADLSSSNVAREAAESDTNELRAEFKRVQQENKQLVMQLSDAEYQVRTLMREVLLLQDPSSEQRLEDDGTPLGTQPSSDDVHSIITKELVTFRSLTELCTQNARLLHAVRELGSKMEAMENTASADQAIEEAMQLLEQVRQELDIEKKTAKDALRERDMYRDACLATESKPIPTLPTVDQNLQAELASLRAENQRMIIARDSAQERVAVLQTSTELHESQMHELRNQMDRLHALISSRDHTIETKELALLHAQNKLEQVQSELHSAVAEAKILGEQRDHLQDENAKLQIARTTAEHALAQAQGLKGEDLHKQSSELVHLREELAQLRMSLATAEARASDQQKQASNAALRREVETRALQERLDALIQQHTQAREALASSQANAMHAERRALDLQSQLEQAKGYTTLFEKQLAAMEESRRAAAAAALGLQDVATESGLTPERQLEMELQDLRRGRAAAQAESLEAQAKLQESVELRDELQKSITVIEQERDTAQAEKQAAESRISQLEEEHQQASEAQSKEIEALKHRIVQVQSELHDAQTNFAQEKRALEDTLAGLNHAESNAASEAPLAWEEVRKFSRLAKEAETRANEALHTQQEAERETERLRDALHRAMSEADSLRHARDVAAAESNQHALSTEAQLRQHEKTIDTLKTQRDELQEQNTQLHTHLEAVSSRNAGASEELANAGDLHKVIRYLRREKDALELQLELVRHEQTRLQQSLQKAQQESRETSAQVPETGTEAAAPESDTATETPSASQAQYSELLDKINQLSSLRELVATLKEAKAALESRVESLTEQLHAAQQQLQPSQEQLQATQVELDTCQTHLRVVQEDVDRWKSRTENLLKSNGVTDAMEKLESERQQAQTAIEQAQAELASEKSRLSNELQTANTRFEQLREQVRARITQERRSVAEATERNNQLQQEKDSAIAQAEEEKQALQNKISELETANAELLAKSSDDSAKETPAHAENTEVVPEKSAEESGDTSAKDTGAAWESQKAQLEESLRLKSEECEKHKNFARTFLKDKRAAEAQVKTQLARIEELEEKLAALEKSQAENTKTESTTSTQADGDQDVKSESSEAASLSTNDQQDHSSAATDLPGKEQKLDTDSVTQSIQNESSNAAPADPAEEPNSSAKETEALRARITELERLLELANKRIAELEAANASTTSSKDARIEELTKQLSAPDGLQAAIEAKEAELKAHYQPLLQTRYDDGKHEATLRNTIMLKQRDNKITKLTNEIQELKAKLGLETPQTASKTDSTDAKKDSDIQPEPASTDQSKSQPNRPAVVRGNAPSRGGKSSGPKPVPLLQRSSAKPSEGTSIRGAAATRGTPAKGRGALTVAGGAKRKREVNTTSAGENESKSKAALKKSKNQGDS
ncbi:Protein mlp1 [Malassezia yamatoensis]|uniref:Protein mlp1 n=1 Tax=Malassezia yamatoensis TaxID=253288 RepID=A0AAJ5YWK5_9BASI|nr:Protein mlp1 [Malassezia yamatoensis]